MIHHPHTLWHPLYGWYDSWNKSGNKKLTLTWQDVLKLRETRCINFQKHQNIKPVIVGKKFTRERIVLSKTIVMKIFSHVAGGVKRAHEDEPRDDMMDTW